MDEIKALIKGVDYKLDSIELRLGERIDKVEGNLEDRFEEVTEDIASLRDRVEDNEGRFDERVKEIIEEQRVDSAAAGITPVDLDAKIDQAINRRVDKDMARFAGASASRNVRGPQAEKDKENRAY